MKIALRKLAITDLSVKYARDMGEGKIRHYRVPYSETVLGASSLKLVKDYIMRVENFEGSEVEFAEEAIASLVAPSTDGSLRIEDVSYILENDKAVEKSLRKFACKSTIHQTNTISRKDRMINFFRELLTPVIAKINLVLQRAQRLNLEDLMLGKGFFLHGINYRSPIRHIHPVSFLSVGFEGCDFQQAKRSLLKDLRILNDKGLILGHLSMPSLMPLADTVGSNESAYVMFCFVVVDHAKLAEIIGKENAYSRQQLKYIGIKNETPEGGINYLNGISPEQKYQIETVDVVAEAPPMVPGQMIETVCAAYEESLPKVSEAASVTRALIKTYHEELAKAQAELNVAVSSAHDKALTAARKKVAKKLTKKKTTKKTVKRKKASKKKVTKKASKKSGKRK